MNFLKFERWKINDLNQPSRNALCILKIAFCKMKINQEFKNLRFLLKSNSLIGIWWPFIFLILNFISYKAGIPQ